MTTPPLLLDDDYGLLAARVATAIVQRAVGRLRRTPDDPFDRSKAARLCGARERRQ